MMNLVVNLPIAVSVVIMNLLSTLQGIAVVGTAEQKCHRHRTRTVSKGFHATMMPNKEPDASLRPAVLVCFEHGWMKADGRISVKNNSQSLRTATICPAVVGRVTPCAPSF
jgi:hypothetical protein